MCVCVCVCVYVSSNLERGDVEVRELRDEVGVRRGVGAECEGGHKGGDTKLHDG